MLVIEVIHIQNSKDVDTDTVSTEFEDVEKVSKLKKQKQNLPNTDSKTVLKTEKPVNHRHSSGGSQPLHIRPVQGPAPPPSICRLPIFSQNLDHFMLGHFTAPETCG